MHSVLIIAIVKHPLGDGGRGMFLIRQHPNLPYPLDESSVELWPRSASQRDDAHIVIRHHQSMGQHLERIEGGIDHNLCLWHLPLDGIGKAKEERIAAGKDDDVGGGWKVE